MAVTVETSPAFIQANSYSAEITRRGIYSPMLQRGASIGSVSGGLIGGTDLQVTTSSNLTVAIAAGEVVVPGSSSTTQSGYTLRVATAGTITCNTANGSNPRIDLIYAQVEDAAYTGSSNLGQVGYAAGTATSGATLTNLTGAPAVPTSSIAIAYILVPATATSLSSGDILNEYTMAYFGPNIFNASPTATSGTASSGQHVIVSANSPTITLPVPFKNARVKVTNYGTGAPVVSQHASEVIYGPGLGASGAASVTLQVCGSSVTLESDETSWYITAGNPVVLSTFITSNVGALAANTPANVTSLTLPAGTWLVNGQVVLASADNAATAPCSIWLGSVSTSFSGTYSMGSVILPDDGAQTVTIFALITLTTSTTVYLEAETSLNGQVSALHTDAVFGTAGNATGMTARPVG